MLRAAAETKAGALGLPAAAPRRRNVALYGCKPEQWVRRALLGTPCVLVIQHAGVAVRRLQAGSETALLRLPLGVIVPAPIVAALIRVPPNRARKGLLMRLATATHLLLVVAVHSLVLRLALGLPVVLVLVETFETRRPTAWRDRILHPMPAS